jgi:hypothetical protein
MWKASAIYSIYGQKEAILLSALHGQGIQQKIDSKVSGMRETLCGEEK